MVKQYLNDLQSDHVVDIMANLSFCLNTSFRIENRDKISHLGPEDSAKGCVGIGLN